MKIVLIILLSCTACSISFAQSDSLRVVSESDRATDSTSHIPKGIAFMIGRAPYLGSGTVYTLTRYEQYLGMEYHFTPHWLAGIIISTGSDYIDPDANASLNGKFDWGGGELNAKYSYL